MTHKTLEKWQCKDIEENIYTSGCGLKNVGTFGYQHKFSLNTDWVRELLYTLHFQPRHIIIMIRESCSDSNTYTTWKTGQKKKTWGSPSKTMWQTFHGQLYSASWNLRDILSSVDAAWFHRHRNTQPAVYYLVTHEMLQARHFSWVLPRVTLARHCPFSQVVHCRWSFNK